MKRHPIEVRTAACIVLMASGLFSVAENSARSIAPVGRPKYFSQGKHRMYGVWFEDGVWKLRTTSGKGVKVDFTGSVEIDTDKITPDYSQLEGSKKKLADSDLVRLNKSKNKMDFRFVTFGATDGIDFKVGPKAKSITFKLRTADDDDPKFIVIGGKGVHPDKGTFTLPANPNSADNPDTDQKALPK